MSKEEITVEELHRESNFTMESLVRFLKKCPSSINDIAQHFNVSVKQVKHLIKNASKTHCIKTHGNVFVVDRPTFGRISVDSVDNGDWMKIGLVSDTHLACKEERLDCLHTEYDLFEREGIKMVFHAGNIVDGYIPRINGNSVFCTGVDEQVAYVVDNYPSRKGIVTYFITGDDHEGWWMKDQGLNFGAYLEMFAKNQGRNDLVYIGHIEADVEFRNKGGSIVMKVQHPGGGSAYSRSYAPQRQVESMQGGEKPAILVQGHYHVSNFMFERNVYVVNLPGFQEQTIFARKKRLRMDVGGVIVEFKQNPNTGAITRFRSEYTMFFDRGYYRNFIRSDARLVKGHLIVNGRSIIRQK